MTILLDMTKKKRYRTGICYTCKGHEKTGKVILPDDKNATYDAKTGKYTCGVCNLQKLEKVTSLFGRMKTNENQ